jgi:hypothetical protein
MSKSQPEDISLDSFLNLFLHHFSVALFFVKPIMEEKFPVVRETKKVDDGSDPQKRQNDVEQKIFLKMAHYNLLWLIDELSNVSKKKIDGHKVIELQLLTKFFIWYTASEYRYVQRVRNMANDLYKTGFLDRIKVSQKTYYRLSQDGINLLKTNRATREKYLKRFFELKEIKSIIANKPYRDILGISKKITDPLWKIIIEESEEIEIPEKPPKKT